MTKNTKIIIIILLIISACIASYLFTPIGRAIGNSHIKMVKKVDDATNYTTQKHVEDTCRAMIASYTADKLTYEQYSGSESKEQQSWADQAKMRANKTAATYNNYILENSFIWEGNVPSDISNELPYIQ